MKKSCFIPIHLFSVQADDPLLLKHTGQLGIWWNTIIGIYDDMAKKLAPVFEKDKKLAALCMPILVIIRELLGSIVMYVK